MLSQAKLSLEMQAFDFLHSLSHQCTNPAGFGSFSPSVYDTAWVSMVKRDVGGTAKFLFPEAFDHLLETQLPDGSWPSYSFAVDGILNTLAASFALKYHSRYGSRDASELEKRFCKAERALCSMFKDWDVKSTDRVGLEILLPGLLRLLGKESVRFKFSGQEELAKLGEAKLAVLDHVIHGQKQTTLLHSLEAVVGILDFDMVKHHKLRNGSMMNSPSSTAAYLMNASTWDDQAEDYLRSVMEHSRAKQFGGGVPSAFPTPIFELAWATTTLLRTGFSITECGQENVANITNFLEKNMKDQNWLVGFALNCLPDADDTAKSLLALRMMNHEVDFEPMLAEFEKSNYFITYPGERNSSFSANCNVLASLLQSKDVFKYTPQIAKCTAFLDDAWRSGRAQDKWNTSRYYSMMLLAQSFTTLIDAWESERLDPAIGIDGLTQSIPATLLDMYIHIILHQHEDGSWSSKHEVTAYSILALSSLLTLPWESSIKAPGISCIEKGKRYLLKRQHLWAQGERLWIEKVAYSSSNLSYAYCLAAANAPIPEPTSTKAMCDSSAQSTAGLEKQAHFFSTLDTFTKFSRWKLEACLTQSTYFVPQLRNMQLKIFPEMGKAKVHKYVDFIPLTWIGCNHLHNSGVLISVLWEMMVISMLNFQVDAYMESFVEETFRGNLEDVRRSIDRAIISSSSVREKRRGDGIMHQTRKRIKMDALNGSKANGASSSSLIRTDPEFAPTNGFSNTLGAKSTSNGEPCHATLLKSLETTLVAFTTHVLRHPLVLRSPKYLQNWLSQSLHAFLSAHITHMEDCKLLSSGDFPKETYYNWVHTTSADHTSCLYSFVFYLCLMHGARTAPGKSPVDLFPGAKTKYMLEDACRRLATICRQHNDFGSLVRDRQEGNLNSLDFPEFDGVCRNGMNGGSSSSAVAQAKKEVLQIADYERQFVDLALAELRKDLDESVMKELMLFFHVTDLYGEIYLSRDMSPSRSSLQAV